MTRPRPDFTPPHRDGVGPSRVAVSGGPWACVLDFLQTRLPAGRPWAPRLAAGDVLDLQGRPQAAEAPCPHGAVFWYWRCLPSEAPLPLAMPVLYQDEHLVVVDKPHFLPVTPGGRHLQETALVRAKRALDLQTLVPMHRLDLETAGVLLFIVQPAERHAYQSVLRERRAMKVYEAVAPWRPELPLPLEVRSRLQEREDAFMQMQTVPGEPNAHTLVALIRRLGPAPAGLPWPGGGSVEPDVRELALYRLQPHTGRKHQLRAHMAALGLPIVGDRIYPRLWPHPQADALPDHSQPLQLLAREISFTDPVTGQHRCFGSEQQLQWARCG